MVYAMNLGFVVEPAEGRFVTSSAGHVVLSHMRYAERRMETSSAATWFAGRGFTTSYVGRDGVGAHLEAGDAFAWGDALVVGYGPRTEELALKSWPPSSVSGSAGCGSPTRGCTTSTSPSARSTSGGRWSAPAAFDDASAAALLALVPEPLVLTEEEALTTFCANSIVIGRTVRDAGRRPERRRARSSRTGASRSSRSTCREFHKGGGSIRCLTNPIDVAPRPRRPRRATAARSSLPLAVPSSRPRADGDRRAGHRASIACPRSAAPAGCCSFAAVARRCCCASVVGSRSAGGGPVAGFAGSAAVEHRGDRDRHPDPGRGTTSGSSRPTSTRPAAAGTSAARRPDGFWIFGGGQQLLNTLLFVPAGVSCWCWRSPGGGPAGCWCRSGWSAARGVLPRHRGDPAPGRPHRPRLRRHRHRRQRHRRR